MGPIPKATIWPTAFPVEYSDRGRSRPTTTTAVVKSRLKPMPSKTASNDKIVGFEIAPHRRKVIPYVAHPAT